MDGRSQKRGQETRAEIVNVARRLFSDYGYYATGIADIQQATGLTKGAFYHHFRTKEELALAVLEAARGDYRTCLLEPLEKLSPGKRLAATLDAILELNTRPEWRNCQMVATLCAELTNEEARLQEVVCKLQEGMYAFWKGLIEEAQQTGEAHATVDAAVWAQWIVNTLTGAQITRKLGSARVPADRMLALIKQAILKSPE